LLNVNAGIKLVHVPYKGVAPAIIDLLAGHVSLSFPSIPVVIHYVRGGKLRMISVCAAERVSTLPEVPTMHESGVKDFVLTSWGALVMPKGTPPAVVNKLSQSVQAVAADASMQQRFMDAGAKLVSSTPAQTHAFAASERIKWKEAVMLSGAKLDS
jgi:tripartite-type tricarboxylate transporter receptor subunit TctC